MQSNNPVFTRNEAFNGQAQYGQTTYGQSPYGQAPVADPYGQLGDPSTWGAAAPMQPASGRMTMDSVIQKSAIVLALIVVSALVTWNWVGATNILGEPTTEAVSRMSMASMVGGGLAFVLSLVLSFSKSIKPALVMVFAVAQGVALGALSKMFDMFVGSGVVTGAVLGTIAAFGGTLAAYKYFGIKVTNKFRKGVVAAMFGMVGLSLVFLVMNLFGSNIGSFDSPLGLLMSVVGLVLGVFMLIMDFDSIEQGIAAGVDEKVSWLSAFGLAVSLVWIYTNLLRILAYFQSND